MLTRISALRARRKDDSGLSLIELLMSSLIFTMVMAICTAGIIVMMKSSDRSNGQANDFEGARRIIDLLDRTARYANAVTTPGTGTDGGYYFEFRTGNSNQQQTCTQWRYTPSSGAVTYRTWQPPLVGNATVTPTSWVTIVPSGISLVGTTPIWQLNPTTGDDSDPAVSGADKETVAIEFNMSSGAPTQSEQFAVSFTAANSTSATAPTSICKEVGRP